MLVYTAALGGRQQGLMGKVLGLYMTYIFISLAYNGMLCLGGRLNWSKWAFLIKWLNTRYITHGANTYYNGICMH